MTKRIGILGGMGAAAGALMFTKLVQECQKRGAVTDSDFPPVVVLSMASKSMDNAGNLDGPHFYDDLLTGVRLLNRCRCTVILIACNTAHVFRSELQKQSQAKIVNMPLAAKLAYTGRKIGVLCTRLTQYECLYGNDCVYVSDLERELLYTVIDRVVRGLNKPVDELCVRRLIRCLKRRGAEVVFLGCTELPLLIPCGGDVVDPAVPAIREALSL